MKGLLKILAIVIVLALAGTYIIYALEYRGNYNLDVSVNLNVSADRTISLTEFISSSSPTDALQFWEQLKGGGSSATEGYMITMLLNHTTGSVSLITRCLVPLGESKVLEQTFSNVPSGAATVKITVRDAFGASLYDKTYSVVIG